VEKQAIRAFEENIIKERIKEQEREKAFQHTLKISLDSVAQLKEVFIWKNSFFFYCCCC
jgi:hypothetical protein